MIPQNIKIPYLILDIKIEKMLSIIIASISAPVLQSGLEILVPVTSVFSIDA